MRWKNEDLTIFLRGWNFSMFFFSFYNSYESLWKKEVSTSLLSVWKFSIYFPEFLKFLQVELKKRGFDKFSRCLKFLDIFLQYLKFSKSRWKIFAQITIPEKERVTMEKVWQDHTTNSSFQVTTFEIIWHVFSSFQDFSSLAEKDCFEVFEFCQVF